jgi:hypothetical protein
MTYGLGGSSRIIRAAGRIIKPRVDGENPSHDDPALQGWNLPLLLTIPWGRGSLGGKYLPGGVWMNIEYYKAVAQELREHLEYRKRKPLLWLTRQEASLILTANRHWNIDEKKFKEIYREIQKKVTEINRKENQPTKEKP